MAITDTAQELVKQMLAAGTTSLRLEITNDQTKKKYFVLVREAASGDIIDTRSVLYPSASSACKCCGK